MKKLLFFIIWIIIILGILIVGLPWDTITSQYYKYKAGSEPDEYSKCKLCPIYGCNKYMHRIIGYGYLCDDCIRYEWWIKTETGEEYVGEYKEGE